MFYLTIEEKSKIFLIFFLKRFCWKNKLVLLDLFKNLKMHRTWEDCTGY